jgi:hypothetical protein
LKGFANGYVARFYGPNGVPALAGRLHEAVTTVPVRHRVVATVSNPYTAETSVFAREPANVRIE